MTELKQQYLRPMEWFGELFLMTVQHNCPSCGNIRKSNISKGIYKKQTICMVCNTEYELNRSMHIPGLVNKRVAR